MGATNFPNGVTVGDDTGVAATFKIGTITIPVVAAGTGLLAATGMGTITTGLGGAVSTFQATYRNQPAGGGTTIGPIAGSATGASGQVVVTYYDKAGVQGTATAPIYWIATGTA